MRLAALLIGLMIFLPGLAGAADNELSPEEKEAGFKLLFDGQSLAGW